MSAFIVDNRHLDYLISAGLKWSMPHLGGYLVTWTWHDGHRRPLTRENANQVGAMLAAENQRSVNERYELDELESLYTFTPYRKAITAVQVLKALSCYEYQSCEHDAWETSEAKRFCEALRHRAISMLPGYETAEWAISA